MSRGMDWIRILCLALIGTAGCYAPRIPDEQYACAADAECPDGQHCSKCGTCIAKSKDVSNCRIENPCTNGAKARTSDDPQLPHVAFCPAAFQEPGVQTPARCKNAPGPDGTGADKTTRCSIADNCAAGWHVCNDADLAAAGLDRPTCASARGFYLSRQVGLPGGINTASCGISGDSVAFGCGGGNAVGRATACNVLDRALVAAKDCEDAKDICITGTAAITITRPDASLAGGVLCCK